MPVRHRRGATIVFILALGLLATVFAPPIGAADENGSAAVRKELLRKRILDHFTLGVDAPGSWIAETKQRNGCRWDIRAQYLSGEVGQGRTPWWITYNSHVNIINESISTNTVTWFTFYMLAASAPAFYKPGPALATPVNARVSQTMNLYFEAAKQLMIVCGKAAPHPIVIQVEPDEWCHLLLSAGMDPNRVQIKVGGSGHPDLKDLPDNLFGYADAFKRLRDKYAPRNVLLATNPSGWDASGSMSGLRMGATFKAVCGDWDLAVFETGDRDKGLAGKQPPYGNRIDVTGNLEGHLSWIANFHAVSGLPVVIWQAAVGNTYFVTCNQTPGHYMDNLAQMLLEDYPRNPTIRRYAEVGCVGWIFLRGQPGSTAVFDSRGDGITNPPPAPGNEGHKSEYADDDGGYMRLRAAAYYKKPYYLKGHRSKDGDNGTLEGLAASAGAAAPAPAATGAAAPAVAASVPVPAASASSDAVATPSASAAAGTEVNARTSALRAYARALTGTNTASAAVAVPSTVQVVAPTPTPQATAQTTPQPPKDPAGGLVAYWTFDAPDVTRFSDASGMGHVAHKVGGGRLQPGKQGMALLLDSTAYLKATNNQWLNAKEAVTVALWVRPDAAGDFGIVTNLRADGTGGGYRLALRRERAEFEVRADPKRARSTGEVAGGVQLQSGLWYHVAGVYSARDGLLRTYVNGRLDRQVEAPPTSFAPSAATELLIGCEADGQGRWVGCLDDLRLYNRALSVEEIAVLARANAATTVLAPASR